MAEQFDLQTSPAIQGMSALASQCPKDFQGQFSQLLQLYMEGKSITAALRGNQQIADAVQKEFLSRYDAFIMRYSDAIYVRPLQDGKPIVGDLTYKRLEPQDIEKIVTSIYHDKARTINGGQIDAIIDSLSKAIRVKREEVQLDNSLIEITPNMFWDGKTGGLSSEPNGACARKLFDTAMDGKNIVKYPPHAFDEYEGKIKSYMKCVYQELEESDGDLREDPRLDFVSTWANHDHETYLDILRMFASNFMEPKPFGVYMLIGEGRNGKSVCIGLLHTLFGTRNTTRIQLKQLGEWHYNLEFANTLLNAPDEEENKVIEDQALFKSLADHGEVKLARMARQDALTVQGDFMIVIPMNHTPKWPKDGAEACIRRTRIIAFNADLSKEDAKPVDFARETFTPKRMAYLLGVSLAIAKYYLTHPFPDSVAMKQERALLEEEMVSGKVYREKLQKYFNGYKKRELLEDYHLWCKARHLQPQGDNSFKRLFHQFERRATKFATSSAKYEQGYRMSAGRNLLYGGYEVPEFMGRTVAECHEMGWSVVAILENEYDEIQRG